MNLAYKLLLQWKIYNILDVDVKFLTKWIILMEFVAVDNNS